MQKWYQVIVTIDGETFEDEILGVSWDDALAKACNNWETAEDIQVLGR